MPPRRNDPLGVSDNPVVVTDPARQAEVLEEFLRRLDYIIKSYRLGKETSRTLGASTSLARLKKTVGDMGEDEGRGRPLNEPRAVCADWKSVHHLSPGALRSRPGISGRCNPPISASARPTP